MSSSLAHNQGCGAGAFPRNGGPNGIGRAFLMATFRSATLSITSNGARPPTTKPAATARAHAVSGRATSNCLIRTDRTGQSDRVQIQPVTAPTVEPNVLVARSTNELKRLGANNWATSTDPLKTAPLSTARTRVAPQEAPRPARQMASKNPKGMNKSTLLTTSAR